MVLIGVYIKRLIFLGIFSFAYVVGAAEDTLIPVVYYTPETSVAGGIIYLQNFGEIQEGKASGIRYIGIYTANSQSFFIIRPDFWFRDGQFNLAANFMYKDFPSRFFGTGNQTEKKGFEEFSERSQNQKVEGAWRVVENIYLHVGYSRMMRELYQVEEGKGLEQVMQVDSDLRSYTLQGYGGGISWDNRDLLRYPSLGGFYKMSYWDFHHEHYKFNQWNLDLRKYWSMSTAFAGSLTGAMQLGIARLQGGDNDVPFQSLLKLGGDKILRGYYSGRFRDRARGFLQMELRKRWGSWGMGAFAALGKVATSLANLDNAKEHWGFGLGGHYFLGEDGTSIRLDVGVAERSPSFYFILDQAF